jgi:predicted nucleotidyltransferase
MRLAPSDLQTLQHVIFAELGQEGVQARLFGSRVNDDARGGDIDVHIQLDHDVPNRVWATCMLGAKLERAMHGRKIDVRLLTPSMQKQPIDDVALSQGVLLWQ